MNEASTAGAVKEKAGLISPQWAKMPAAVLLGTPHLSCSPTSIRIPHSSGHTLFPLQFIFGKSLPSDSFFFLSFTFSSFSSFFCFQILPPSSIWAPLVTFLELSSLQFPPSTNYPVTLSVNTLIFKLMWSLEIKRVQETQIIPLIFCHCPLCADQST